MNEERKARIARSAKVEAKALKARCPYGAADEKASFYRAAAAALEDMARDAELTAKHASDDETAPTAHEEPVDGDEVEESPTGDSSDGFGSF